jgi:hydrogenase expression/formation protein HypE
MSGVMTSDRISLKRGAGGPAMRRLIDESFLRAFATDPQIPAGIIGVSAMGDSGAVRIGDRWLVMTTDSHVIQPLFFAGGDIGRLAMAGPINDLAMMGATEALALTCSVILEDGFPRADLDRILESMRRTCREAAAIVVAGDTKVIGKADFGGIVITTTGVGFATPLVRDAGLRPGDRIVVTGTLGDHGMAVMATRHDLLLDSDLQSDVAPINTLIRGALDAAAGAITAMKAPTRGGVSAAVHEMAAKSRVGVILDETALPVRESVRGVAELVGIEPLLIANEGKALLGVRADAVDRVLAAVRGHPLGRDAAVIGVCTEDRPGTVILDTGSGCRLLTEPEAELLPRIC